MHSDWSETGHAGVYMWNSLNIDNSDVIDGTHNVNSSLLLFNQVSCVC